MRELLTFLEKKINNKTPGVSAVTCGKNPSTDLSGYPQHLRFGSLSVYYALKNCCIHKTEQCVQITQHTKHPANLPAQHMLLPEAKSKNFRLNNNVKTKQLEEKNGLSQ
ncbi:hypothetical protein TcasGA2_TC000765 [Tribolium castaneum]|uniref:Uncharacterized protein n=1 Tax=Tribolium castaneum TaxID=7070 RepID=D6WD58_TRICA|nr:hypothetical protein TcasGA2_TC000765 [Tribolium castaneum]